MTEVVLNDKCMHCNNRECHDGYKFCNQAMKENSFYKNAKLYKGLEVIHRPTYAELEKENEELKADNDARKFAMAMSEKVEKQLREENAELKERNRGLDAMLTGESLISNERKEQLTKAKEIILRLYNAGRDVLMCRAEEKAYDNLSNAINNKSIEQFLMEE